MIPASFEQDLKAEEVIYEENGVPFAWGRHIKTHLGDERFQELRSQCKLVHLGDYFSHLWAVVTRENTKTESIEAAIAMHGKITRVHVGPRGGFQWVEYGNKKSDYYGHNGVRFYSDEFNPLRYDESQTEGWRINKHDELVEWDEPTEAMKALAKRNKLRKAARERAKAKKAATKLAKKGQK